MAILHTINQEHGVVLSTWVGVISDSDLLQSYKQLYEDERWKPGFHEIVDAREAQVSDVTSTGLRRLSSMVEGYVAGVGFRTAIVASKDLHFGLARLYEAVSDASPETVMVFREMDEAIEWIGVDDSSFE